MNIHDWNPDLGPRREDHRRPSDKQIKTLNGMVERGIYVPPDCFWSQQRAGALIGKTYGRKRK